MKADAIATPLLILLTVVAGGWAFLRTLDPEIVLAILRVVSFC